ncbi:MAG: asparagine synthase (glutamine-hydrolyzing), partial [Deltaproteobacteria bacterium]|nr:asparagine synthase (glutamine-hydrolyzing) [Deltaproteobacteria bacterium]
QFRSGTDTEVVLKSYIQWGEGCLERFVGMFSIAIWDGRVNRLFLARDRIGIKPLYYYRTKDTIIFASEMKSIMAFEGFPREIDQDAFALFLHFQFVPGPQSIFRNTFKLLPGHYALIDGNNFIIKQYWYPSDPEVEDERPTYKEDTYVDELEQLLTTAVSDRLISDVPLGALLSGGIDSSLVVSIMQKVSNRPVRTFSIGFSEEKYNEAHWSSEIARYLGTNHTEFYVSARDALEVIPKLPSLFDEPFGDSSAIPTALVCAITRSAVTVALSGDGGDELFAGYDRYWKTCKKVTILDNIPIQLKNTMAKLMQNFPLSFIERFNTLAQTMFPNVFMLGNASDKWKTLHHLLVENKIEEIYRMSMSIWQKYDIYDLINRDIPGSELEHHFKRTIAWPLLSRLMMIDMKTILPDDYLTKVDRTSMAVGLEVRVPILDHRIVEYASQIPNHLKLNNGTSKYILKKILNRYLPKKLFERPKKGFGVPIDSWFRGELKPLLMDYLSIDRLRKEGIFNTDIIMKILDEHVQGKANHRHRLWTLLMWEMWREKWMNDS